MLEKIVFAQEVFKFFEFAPRSQEKVTITKNSLEESFIPFNDFLSGFDLFIDNQKVKDLDITILDKNGQIFWHKKAGVPIINGGWWGQEYFFTLGDNYQINSGEEYKLVIKGISSNSSLDIFVKNILEILQGTESFLYFPENLRKLKLDGKETDYTLKLVLYENKETMPPVISNFRLEVINSQIAKILFNSNEPITYVFRYKSNLDLTTSTFEINYFENCPYQIKDCQIILDVLAGRNYNFILEAYDYWQNKTEKEGSFQVLATNTDSLGEGNFTVKGESYSQGQSSQVQTLKNDLKQSDQNSFDFSRTFSTTQKLQKKSIDDDKQILLKKPKQDKQKLDILSEKYLDKRTLEQNKDIVAERLDSQKEKIITKKLSLTFSENKVKYLLNFSKGFQGIKLYSFIIVAFLVLFVFLLRKKFKK